MRVQLVTKSQFYINGKWFDCPAGEKIVLFNPANGETRGHLILGTEEHVNKAAEAASVAFDSFSETPLVERIELIKRIAEVYESRLKDIGMIISTEIGAPLDFATRYQAGAGLSHFKNILKVLESYNFEEDLRSTKIIREPIGVCGMIVPWNWPMNQITCKVAPALAAGCTIVLKPSELAPGTAVILTEILQESGVPPGVFNMVQGNGITVGAAIAAHPKIDMISFTGSTQSGIAVARAAAQSVKRVGQELGGKSANILLDDVNFEEAVSRGVKLCFRNSGQSCNSPARMLVPKSRIEEVEIIAKLAAEKIIVGDPGSKDTDMGPVVSQKQWTKIQDYIQSGMQEGATLVAGGLDLPSHLERGFYIKPTVFSNVTPEMTIAREEIFGPVLSILTYEDERDALQIANDTPFGLAAYVESANVHRAQSLARKLRAGMVHLNGAVADPSAPFGGYRQSGNGREWGKFGLEEFMEIKAVMGFNQ